MCGNVGRVTDTWAMRRHLGRALHGTYGRTRWQPLWTWAHERSLSGLNYGRSSVEESGERHALAYAHRALPGAGVLVDVGANRGDWSVSARALWAGADIHAFEPANATYRELVAATSGFNVTCVQAACGEQEGEATLYAVPGLSELSSLHKRDLRGYDMAMTGTETVPVTTLDAYCKHNDIDRIDYLKIDAEGHDLAVLLGASDIIDAGPTRFIQFEFGGSNIDSRTYLRDFVRLLEPRYRIFRLLSDGLAPVRYSERDEVFVTSNFLAERV